MSNHDQRDQQVLAWIQENRDVALGLVSAASLSMDLGYTPSAMAWTLRRLIQQGQVERHPECSSLYRLTQRP